MDFLKKFNFSLQNPTSIAQLVIAALVAVNLVAAYFMVKPPGGSPEELQAEVRDTTAKLHQQRAVLERTKVLVGKIESGANRATGSSPNISCRAASPIPPYSRTSSILPKTRR